MESLSFSDHFWGQKHSGYDVLYQNMVSGTKASKEFLDYLREVYSMEDNCTKSWSKLSKQMNCNSVGTMQPYWMSLKEYSEKRSLTHSELSQNIQTLIKGVQKYIEEQQIKHKSCKELDSQTQQFNSLLITTTTQLERAKLAYHSRYIEMHKLLKTEQASTGNKSRDIEKQEVKLKKALDEYKYLIEKYNNTCSKFKLKMVESCKNFQEVEAAHLVQMRDFLQRLVRLMARAQAQTSEEQGSNLNGLEDRLTVRYLLDGFVRLKGTGTEPPATVQFEDAELLLTSGRLQLAPPSLTGPSAHNGSEVSISGDSSSVDHVATGNLVNLDPSSPSGAATVADTALYYPPRGSDDLLTLESLPPSVGAAMGVARVGSSNANLSDNASLNNADHASAAVGKKQKKYNKIFRRKMKSPVNTSSIGKSSTEIDKNAEEAVVDAEGYSIKPKDIWNESTHDSSDDSSSDDDDGNQEGLFKGIKIAIKPQEPISDNSSIADDCASGAPNGGECRRNTDHELIKAVQTFKLQSPAVGGLGSGSNTGSTSSRRQNQKHGSGSVVSGDGIGPSSRCNTPGSLKSSKPELQPSSPKQCPSSVVSASSKAAAANSQFAVDFSSAAATLDSWASSNISSSTTTVKLRSQTAVEPLQPPRHQGVLDPWGTPPPAAARYNPMQPPPLPAKTHPGGSPPRAASVVPFSNSKEHFKYPNSESRSPGAVRVAPPPPPLQHRTPAALISIPLAAAITETVHAKFRSPATSSTSSGSSGQYHPHDLHTSGSLLVSFPSSLLELPVLSESGLAGGSLQFCLTRASRLRNVEPCAASHHFVKDIENPDDDTYRVHVDVARLCTYLASSINSQQQQPPFFNVQLVQYDVTNRVLASGSIQAPVILTATWQLGPGAGSSHLLVNYALQWPNADLNPPGVPMHINGGDDFPLASPEMKRQQSVGAPNSGGSSVKGEVRFLVIADGRPVRMQSLPPCVWNSELCRASWRLELPASSGAGTANVTGAIKAKFTLAPNSPGATPQPVACQFAVDGSIESGVTLSVLPSSAFRLSRLKYRLISGRYVWEPASSTSSAIVAASSGADSFCV